MFKRSSGDGAADDCDQGDSTGARVSVERHSPDFHPGRHNLKQWYTSHWDWDYLPRAELEKLIRQKESGRKK